ncbi:MAG TPA: M20/M25/M40 family metallo-hydrolase [Solirubrobacteraceae bacterium]|jgi:acetylornithine deacetylase
MPADDCRATASRIREHVRTSEAELVGVLCELLRVPSVPGSETQNRCQDIIRRELHPSARVDDWVPDWPSLRDVTAPDGRQPYVPVDEERGAGYERGIAEVRCIVATVGEGDPHLVLNGHIDVVPATPDGWDGEPFEPREARGRIYARGAMDMKAGVVAALFAFNALCELRLVRRGSVSLAVVPEEESGGNGTVACLQRGHVGDGVVFAEPTDLRVAHRHIGIQSFALNVRGRAGGILKTGPEGGVSAIEVMVRALAALDRAAHARRERAFEAGGYDSDDDPAFINVGLIEGGEWPASRAESCVARGLFGVMPGESVGDAEAELATAVATAERDGATIEVTFGAGGHAGGELDAGHELVTSLASAGVDLGYGLELSRAGAMVCDAKIVDGGGWAPAVVFGPTGRGLHGVNEYVEVESVLRCAEVLAMAAARYSTHFDPVSV